MGFEVFITGFRRKKWIVCGMLIRLRCVPSLSLKKTQDSTINLFYQLVKRDRTFGVERLIGCK